MTKRKPDPPTQDVTFIGVETSIFYLFKEAARIEHNKHPSHIRRFEDMSESEQEKVYAQYFVSLANRGIDTDLGQQQADDIYSDYHGKQKEIRANYLHGPPDYLAN